jgi:PAS domain S-box-containing protein
MEHNRIRVMVVDDTAANRNLMEAFLRKLGFQSMPAKDGREAVEIFQREHPDMILMDLMMPEMDGFEATRRIRKLQGDRWVPIVILSALNTEQDVVAGLEAEADDYLVKPISFAVFSAKLRTMVRLLSAQRSLESALGRISTITNAVIDGIITVGEDGLIQSANPAAARIFDYPEDDLVGRNVKVLMPEPHHSGHDNYLARHRETGEQRVIGTLREVVGRRRNGESFPLELGVNKVEMQDRTIFIGVVRDITERLRVQQELADNAARLQAYHDEQEREQELAKSIMARQIRNDWLDVAHIQHVVMPASHFSGDLVVAAHSGSRVYAMLADATGHGLAAAVSVQPALTSFYRGAVEGLALEDLLVQINDALVATLPVGRFVGAALLCLDRDTGRGELWVGGVPAVWLVDRAGMVIQSFASSNLPLGIVSSAESPFSPVEFHLGAGSQVVMCSDGVLEAVSRTGVDFGAERLQRALAAASPETRLASVTQALTDHLGGGQAHDDMSLLIVACQ